MLRNLEASHGLVFSGRVLLAMVEAGASPRAGLRHHPAKRAAGLGRGMVVSRASGGRRRRRRAARRGRARRVFDLDSFLRHVDEIFERTLDALEVERV